MKKIIYVILLSLLILTLVIVTVSAADAKLVLRWGEQLSASHPNVMAAEMFAKNISEKTNGEIEIQIFPNAQFGSNNEQLEATSQGIQDMVTDGDGPISAFVPWVGVFGAPYIYRDEAQMVNVVKGPIFAKMKKDLIEKLNIRILGGALFYGWRYLTTRDTPVYSVEDVKGLKLRVPGGKVHLDMERAWGAVPTPMSFGELYLALSQGVIDGQDNPLPVISSAKFYEVQKYLIATKHMNNVRFFLINEDVFQKLTPEQQIIFEEAAKEAVDYSNNLIKEDEDKLLAELQEKGMTLIIPDVESFRKATMKIFPEYEDNWGKGVVEEIMNTP